MIVRDWIFRTVLGALAVVGAAKAASAQDSVYTSIRVEDCVLFDIGQVHASTACPGAGGYTLNVTDADLRIYLSFVHPNWTTVAEIGLLRQSFSALVADAVEWRVDDSGRPIAMIVRLSWAQLDGGPDAQGLFVIRLDDQDPERVCVIGDLPSASGANQAARALADRLLDPSDPPDCL